MTMMQLVRHKKMLPTRVARFCCASQKEVGGKGRFILTGVRWEESIKRKKRKMNERCFRDPSKNYCHPIIDWTAQGEIWPFIRKYNVPYCELYDPPYSMKRIGCVMCPLTTPRQIRQEMEMFPKIAEMWRRVTNRIWEAKDPGKRLFNSGDDMFRWWVSGRSAKEWAKKDTSFWAYE